MSQYQFLEIKNVGGIEIAYLLDTFHGRVVRVKVEDFVVNGIDDRVKTDSIIPSTWKKAMKKQVVVDESDGEDDGVADKPIEKKLVIIPPALRGVFMPADTPGAAVETRRV